LRSFRSGGGAATGYAADRSAGAGSPKGRYTGASGHNASSALLQPTEEQDEREDLLLGNASDFHTGSGNHSPRTLRRQSNGWNQVGGGSGGDSSQDDAESLQKFWHRAGWLVGLLMFQSMSSLILEYFDILIRKHPIVIYFLTMLVGAGGNAGGQSTVLVVRQLALAACRGKASDTQLSMAKVVGDEVSVGLRLSGVLFCAAFLRCFLFDVRGNECLAICLSMVCIVFFSTIIGAALPLLLQRLQLDPAHAGAAIQVVMDISGVTITCVVSCLVLGLQLGGHPDGQFPAATDATDPGIQREGTRHSLHSVGVSGSGIAN